MTLRLAYAALTALACFGLTYNLGDRMLWTDEAETALLAVNITKFGLPIADDGKNDLQRTRSGSRSEHNLWVWSPWLDEYVAASSFALLGRSTFSARLPFALLALASVALLCVVAWRASGSHELVLLAGFLYATCVPFVLHARQCRYYAIVMLAQLWFVYGLQRTIAVPTLRSAAHMTGALATIFYCNYIFLPGNVLGVAVSALLLRRRQPRLIPLLVASGAALLVLTAPWLLYARPEAQVAMLGVGHLLPYLIYYLGEIHYHVVSLGVLLLLPAAMLVLERWAPALARAISSQARGLWQSAGARDLRTIVVPICIAQLMVLSLAPDDFFRYLTPLIPLLLLMTAFILVRFIPTRPLRVGVAATLVASNFLSVGMFLPFPKAHAAALSYPTFLASITRDYSDRFEAVLMHLDGKTDPEDSAYVDDHELPLIFYTQMRILDPRASRSLFTRESGVQPDWVFPTAPSALVDFKEMKFRPGPHYEKQTIDVPRSPRGGSRPHPDAHAFFSAERRQPFVLYRKRTGNSRASARLGAGD